MTRQELADAKVRIEQKMRERGGWRDDISPTWRVSEKNVECHFPLPGLNAFLSARLAE